MFSVASVCVSVCLSVTLYTVTFERSDLGSLFFGMRVRHRNFQLKLVYRGHRVKVKVRVKVRGAKKFFCLYCSRVICLRLKGTLFIA